MEKNKKIQHIDTKKAARISKSGDQPAQKTLEVQEKPKHQNALSRPHMLFK
nr:hypothetical protein [Pedobacter panaciterrae]